MTSISTSITMEKAASISQARNDRPDCCLSSPSLLTMLIEAKRQGHQSRGTLSVLDAPFFKARFVLFS